MSDVTDKLAEALRRLYWRHCKGDEDISARLNADVLQALAAYDAEKSTVQEFAVVDVSVGTVHGWKRIYRSCSCLPGVEFHNDPRSSFEIMDDAIKAREAEVASQVNYELPDEDDDD